MEDIVKTTAMVLSEYGKNAKFEKTEIELK
jgi:hypothetical protein